MNDLKRSFNIVTIGSMVMDVLFIALSIFVIANPSVGVSSALLLFGIALIISGIYSIIKYLINNNKFFKFELVYGMLSLIIGLLAVFKPFTVVNLISILVGLWMVISSVFKCNMAIQLRKFKEDTWTFDLGISVLTIILGVLIMVNPFSGFIILTTYVAILVMVYSGIDFVEQLFIRQRASRIVSYFKK